MASKSSNRAEVPEAKEALDRFKMEVANELGVPLRKPDFRTEWICGRLYG